MLQDLITHTREDVGKITESQARAMLEMTAEVAQGLKKAFEHHETQAEEAFRR